MARRISFAPGEYYHIYNRGTEKRKVYLTKADHERFISLLYLANGTKPIKFRLQGAIQKVFQNPREKKIVDIAAYCLMPNHFHLLIREKEEGGISRFMQRLITAYTMYFNILRKRDGALFQGKFKAKHVDGSNYFKYLVAYIHLNPVKIIEPMWKKTGIADRRAAEKFLASYAYSSYQDYVGNERQEKNILSKEALLEYQGPIDFQKSVTDWLAYQPVPEVTKVEPR